MLGEFTKGTWESLLYVLPNPIRETEKEEVTEAVGYAHISDDVKGRKL